MHEDLEPIFGADIHPGAARALADLHNRLRTRALEMLADPSTDKESREWAKKWVTSKPASGTLGATEQDYERR